MTDLFDFGEELPKPKIEIKSDPIIPIQEIIIPKIKTVSVLGKIYEVNVE